MTKRILIAVICLISINAKAQSLTGNEVMDAHINGIEALKTTIIENWEKPYKQMGIEVESDIYYSKKSRSIVYRTEVFSKKVFTRFTTSSLSAMEKTFWKDFRVSLIKQDPSGGILNEFIEAVKETGINYRWVFVYKDKSIVEVTDSDELIYYLRASSK